MTFSDTLVSKHFKLITEETKLTVLFTLKISCFTKHSVISRWNLTKRLAARVSLYAAIPPGTSYGSFKSC